MSFLPKVIPDFQLNEGIILPRLCPHPLPLLEVDLHFLDMVYYNFLTEVGLYFCAYGRAWRPPLLPVLGRFVRLWCRLMPFRVDSSAPWSRNSARAISASWGSDFGRLSLKFARQLPGYVCFHVSTIYEMDVFGSSDVCFGRKVFAGWC